VVSAMKGVTDALIGLADAATTRGNWLAQWTALHERHRTAARELLHGPAGNERSDETLGWIDAQFKELHGLLGAIALLGPAGAAAKERVHGLGEVWSAQLLAEALIALGADAVALDARE